jgi:hypothetical protein
MFAVIKICVTDISASTGRNDFIFDKWLLHGELDHVSPFQVTVITKILACGYTNPWCVLFSQFIMICEEFDVSD